MKPNILPVPTLNRSSALKIAGWTLVLCVAVIYAGGFVLGVTKIITAVLLHVMEFLGLVAIPILALAALLWFAYKFFLEPVIRQRRLDRIRELRAKREAKRLD